MSQVEAVHTDSDATTVAGAIVRAYRRVVGRDPVSQGSWLLPLAQAAVETANFQGGLWNWNLGNITAGSDAIDWMALPGNALHFRSYASLDDGADALIHWLASHGAIAAADAGDIGAYVAALQAGNYLGSDPAPYAQYQANIAAYVSSHGGVVPASPIGHTKAVFIGIALVAAAGLVAYYIIEGEPKKLLAMENPQGSMKVQSLLFDRNRYTVAQAKTWARGHGFVARKVDVTEDKIRLRQLPSGRFGTMRTKDFGHGIKAVVAR